MIFEVLLGVQAAAPTAAASPATTAARALTPVGFLPEPNQGLPTFGRRK